MAVETNVEKLARERKEKELVEKQQNQEDMILFSYDKLAEANQERKDLIVVMHKQVAKNTTLPEFAYFLQYCKAIGLNPILKEVWCYKDHKDNVIIFAGKDGFVKKAKEDQMYLGYLSATVYENDDFVIDIPNIFVDHNFNNKDRGKIIGAWCWVKSKDKTVREDVLSWVPFSEFDKGQSTWSGVPSEMIKKVAECHALKQFVGIAGLQNEYEFKVGKDDKVTHMTEILPEKKELKQEKKEEERLEKMIESADTMESLRKLMTHCQTPELIEMYNNKKNELNKERSTVQA